MFYELGYIPNKTKCQNHDSKKTRAGLDKTLNKKSSLIHVNARESFYITVSILFLAYSYM